MHPIQDELHSKSGQSGTLFFKWRRKFQGRPRFSEDIRDFRSRRRECPGTGKARLLCVARGGFRNGRGSLARPREELNCQNDI